MYSPYFKGLDSKGAILGSTKSLEPNLGLVWVNILEVPPFFSYVVGY
jgi:hypothetical protein